MAWSAITGIKVEAAAFGDPFNSAVSPSAIKALAEIKCDEWLKEHRPRKLCLFLRKKANLIVVFPDRVNSGLIRIDGQNAKVITDEELFGKTILDPFPDKDDEKSLETYRDSRNQLEIALKDRFNQILERMNAVYTI